MSASQVEPLGAFSQRPAMVAPSALKVQRKRCGNGSGASRHCFQTPSRSVIS
jgi:hypothetical protein